MTIDGTLKAYNQNEKRFYEFIRHALRDKFVQRIETSTGSGVPDLFIGGLPYGDWFELKIVLKRGVLLRREQYAWAMRYSLKCGEAVVLLALDMIERKISSWRMSHSAMFPHIDVEPCGKKYVKVLNEPLHVCNQDTISFRDMLGIED